MKKTIYIFVPIFLCFVLVSCSFGSLINTSESIADKVFRLHIVANSDSQADQTVKLQIRDALLAESEEWFCRCRSVQDAAEASRKHQKEIGATAARILRENGFDYGTAVTVTRELFDTRQYNDFTLPSGHYQCLKVVLGSGEGHNWWCVMFPSVCLSACSDGFDGVLSQEEQALIHENYTVKFKIIELYEAYFKENNEG